MRNWILLNMFFSLLLFSSCEKHIEEEDVLTEIKVGNVLCQDGSVVHPTLLNEKKPVAVIFWCNVNDVDNTDLAYAVSIQDIGEDFLTERMENIGDVSEDMQSYDGLKNTSAYKIDAEKDSLAVPAVDLALNYEAGSITGWYIGSVAQHTELFRNKDIVYDTFEKINGEIMKGYYWTSTEVESSPNYYSYSFSYEGDSEKSLPALKNKKYKVRPFVTISRKK